jgi:RNA polymerase sigma-70 factor (ECF subfamily)
VVTGTTDEAALIAALRAGDRIAFARLVDEYTPAMLRVACTYVPSHAIAEEVVQETWMALVGGASRFEGGSSLRTWLFTVVMNIAKARGIRERQDTEADSAHAEATVGPVRFHGSEHAAPGSWSEPPSAFPDNPEGSVLNQELAGIAQRELDKLSERQRIVVTLRDVLGLDSAEVCELLDITVGNQRILLHRGRAAIRRALEDYVREDFSAPTDP